MQWTCGFWAITVGCVGQIDFVEPEAQTPSTVAQAKTSSPVPATGTAVEPGTFTPVSAVTAPTPTPTPAPAIPIVGRCAPLASARALRRLSNVEYDNTVQDLLGTKVALAKEFLREDDLFGYKNSAAALAVPPAIAQQYADAAIQLAAAASKNIQNLAPCAANAIEADCATTFIRTFGKRSYRRPLTDGEVQAFTSLFQTERARSTYAGGIGILVETMLQSPFFLFKSELGVVAGTTRRLTPHEIAVQVSYMVTGSMPDADLFAAADAAKLATPENIEVHVRRLSQTARARVWLGDFLLQWMGVTEAAQVSKDGKVYPSFDKDLRAAIAKESVVFVGAILTKEEGSLSTFFDAPWTFSNALLSRHYGLANGPTGTELQKVDLPVDQRAGILTQPAFLVTHSKANESFPIARGKFIRERLFCKPLAPPPANVNVSIPPSDGKLTTRERFAQHSSVPLCAGCHRFIDGLGFGLENYDGIGAYRAKENGKPIDASGELVDAGELDGPFVGGVELAKRISRSVLVRDCAARQAFRWAVGRLETSSEECVISRLGAQLGAAGLDVRELLVAITRMTDLGTRALD